MIVLTNAKTELGSKRTAAQLPEVEAQEELEEQGHPADHAEQMAMLLVTEKAEFQILELAGTEKGAFAKLMASGALVLMQTSVDSKA